MAESTEKKGKKSKDSFTDDLDSMLNVEDGNEQQVGLIDDDDAIDRLLVGDVFAEESQDETSDAFADIDQLIADTTLQKPSAEAQIDEFGDDDIEDIIAGLDIKPKQAEELIAELPELDTAAAEVDLSALETVGKVDEFANATSAEIKVETIEPVAKPKADEFDSMTEIDEFADEAISSSSDNADFLLADFNISADDETVSAREILVEQNAESALDAAVETPNPELDDFAEADIVQDLEPVEIESVVELEPAESAALEIEPETVSATIASPQPVPPPAPQIDYAPQLAALAEQFNELKKLQKQNHHDLQFKVDNEALNACLETVDTLQTEQKKAKRNLDALLNKKPVGVYVANGVAGLAMLVAAGLGIEAFITKSQVNQLVEIIGQLKQQTETAPAADAADKELLRKQVDELAVAQGVASSQLAELNKALHGEAGGEKPSGDFGKKLTDLNNQDMQMGAAIEALQTKVAALEKGKSAAVATAKPAPKKPEVVEENWVVNLVAFKQDWYAKRKAEEFAGKGVPAKVGRADNKGETWYRLSVDGFKSQYEAAAYAAKVKKTLNLDSVWVAKNKD